MNPTAPAAALLDTILDALLRRRDEATVRALFEARIRKQHRRKPNDAQLSFVFGWGKKQEPEAPAQLTDDERFQEAMTNWDVLMQRALERKRRREAEEEDRRSQASKRGRKTQTINEQSVKGRMLASVRGGGEWTIPGFVQTLGCTVTAARVFAHELAKEGLLIRAKRGVYRAAQEQKT